MFQKRQIQSVVKNIRTMLEERVGSEGMVMDWKGAQGMCVSDRNSLYLDRCVGYMDICICKPVQRFPYQRAVGDTAYK